MTEVLQEYVDSRGVALRVDHEPGVLRGVKLLGLKSRNGRRYRESALAQAARLYEESKVNANHAKNGPLAPRDYQDRLGVIRDVKLRPGEGLFGDLHFNPKHTLAEQLVWDAEHNPRNVGFSHNVLARLSRDGEQTVVEEITQVQSVDLVADPATTQGLFEQKSADSQQIEEAEKFTWSALTIEVLGLHRPDLLEQIESQRVDLLQQELDQRAAHETLLERRQQIAELLHEHGLPWPTKTDDSSSQIVSPAFIETLLKAADVTELRKLIAERIELIHSATSWQSRTAFHNNRPSSRDQIAEIATRSGTVLSAEQFAKALITA